MGKQPAAQFRTVEHPLLRHYLGVLRDKNTNSEDFGKATDRLSTLLVAETTRDLETSTVSIQTPLEPFEVKRVSHQIVLVPILRAGLGMVNGFKQLLPGVAVAHLGLYRDEETLKPVVYYKKLPQDLSDKDLIILDPMLATGGTACAAIRYLKERNPLSIRFVCLLAAPEGVGALASEHPDIPVVAAALDREINDKGYILPGLGDAGDRMFGTEF